MAAMMNFCVMSFLLRPDARPLICSGQRLQRASRAGFDYKAFFDERVNVCIILFDDVCRYKLAVSQ